MSYSLYLPEIPDISWNRSSRTDWANTYSEESGLVTKLWLQTPMVYISTFSQQEKGLKGH